MKRLIKELNDASYLYYNGEQSLLSDKEWDDKFQQLKLLEEKNGIIYANSPTQNVGSPVLSEVKKVNIAKVPMLSLDKTHDALDIIKFSEMKNITLSIKCDGVSVRIIYKDGELISANTRGDGYIGSDITDHIKQFKNVPLRIDKKGEFIVDGEAIIFDDDFDILNVNGDFENSRNTVAGSLRLLDMTEVKRRNLSFIAWDNITKEDDYLLGLVELNCLGFDVVPFLSLPFEEEVYSVKDITQINIDTLNLAAEKGIPCDGIVYKFDDKEFGRSKGKTQHHFLNGIAWKPEHKLYETELVDIDYDISRKGILTPVAVFKPVEIDGTTVTRATLSNINVLENTLGSKPFPHQIIWVTKRNMIIPKIEKAEKNEEDYKECIDIPKVCPVCGEPLNISINKYGTKILVCENSNCGRRITNLIDHFCSKTKGVEIKGLSRQTIEKLVDWGWIKNISDLYQLYTHSAEWSKKAGFGSVGVNKILNAIEESKTCELWRFISALGIPLIGPASAKVIARNMETWCDFRTAIEERYDFCSLKGFGIEMEKSIRRFNYSQGDYLAEIFEITNTLGDSDLKDSSLDGLSFCITGKSTLGTRDEVRKMIEKKGGKVTGNVSAVTKYLLANKPETSVKYNRAIQYGTEIINDEKLLELLGN